MNTFRPTYCWRLLSVATIIVAPTGCSKRDTSPKESKVVHAAYVPAAYYLPFLVVESDKLLSKRGYTMDLVPFNDNSHMINLFLNGHIDVTAQSSLTMFPVEAKNGGLFKFIAAQYNYSCFFVVAKDSPISTLADLKGKKVATWKSPTATALIGMLLRRQQLTIGDSGDVVVVPYGANDVAMAVENGQVDAAFIFDAPAAKLVTSGKFRYVDEHAIEHLFQDNQRFFNGGPIVYTKVITDEPKKAQAIQEAFVEAVEIIRTKPEHVNRILSEKLDLPLSVVSAMNRDDYVWIDPEVIKAADQLQAMLQKEDPTHGDIKVDTLFWTPSQP